MMHTNYLHDIILTICKYDDCVPFISYIILHQLFTQWPTNGHEKWCKWSTWAQHVHRDRPVCVQDRVVGGATDLFQPGAVGGDAGEHRGLPVGVAARRGHEAGDTVDHPAAPHVAVQRTTRVTLGNTGHRHTHTHAHIRIHTHTHTHTRAYTHIHTHTHTHTTHTHTHTHTR